MKRLVGLCLICVMILLAGCRPPTSALPVAEATPAQPLQPELANPASQNCIDQGGTLSIEKRGDGGEYGICYFEDNRQCEEWALLRGDCPLGGLKITGYVTPAAQYCAITGGTYTISGESNTDNEQGTCALVGGTVCDAWDYYNGVCSAGQGVTPTAAPGMTIQPLSMEVCDGQAQAMAHALDVLAGTPPDAPFIPTQSEAPLDDPVHGASGTGCLATVTATGAQFASPLAVLEALGGLLAEQGWSEDPLLAAGGPTGIGAGYRKGEQISLAAAIWLPDESANCPNDQPISACALTPEQQLYTVTLNSGVELTAGETPGAASGLLVFDSTRGGSYRDLYLMNLEGKPVQRLTEGESNSFAGPWSPDGRRILFTTFGLTNSVIAVVNPDGSGAAVLSSVEGSDEGFPAWSPDGTQIAFTSRRDGNNEIYIMNADGSNPRRMTDAPGDDFAPSWSPDGLQIVFVSDRDQETGVYDLYIMSADGGEVHHLTDDTASDYAPAWSPDGTQIVFRSHRDGPADIYLINVDGSDLHALTSDPAEDWAPSWSPDGSTIAFQTDRDGNWEIYTMARDGSAQVNLTNDPGDDQLPFWQPVTNLTP